ncbi:MAG TPA: hypothetical protein PJ988_13275, partial [Anaerolinea sp.]|nr:hypothetical protein [Anaerolinea sp.]
MGIAPLTLKPTYWKDFQIDDEDLEFLYNHLLEKETPLTPDELVALLVKERIQRERTALETRKTAAGAIYQPKDTYQVGQTLQFPQQDWGRGRVTSVREGNNPDLAAFEVIDVEMETGETHSFAAGLQNHKLNEMMSVGVDDPNLDAHHVLSTYGRDLTKTLSNNLEANPDLVRIAGRWFPRALLVDINIGHLNLAEAILEMADGGPLTTRSLMEQLDLPKDVNAKLNEFSLNLALQEDERFDEVGPAGKILWFLQRLEPESVQQPPAFLRWSPLAYDSSSVQGLLNQFEGNVTDELENCITPETRSDEASLSLIYPHFRAGTLPICEELIHFFP